MSTWRNIDLYLIFLSLFLLLILLVPNLAPEINGAKRWIRFLGFSFQPAELAKLSLLIYVSSFCVRKKEEFKSNWTGFWKPIFIMVSLISLILLQPDLGSSAIIFLVTLTIMFIAGAPIVHFIAIIIGHLNHANIRITWGPFKYILNNSVMHLYHHMKALPENKPKGINFGISLSIWDFLFKTNYVPDDNGEIELGFYNEENFPKGFLGQLLTGFRKN